MEQLPQDVDIVNLSLGGYTDDDSAPLAIASALQIDAQAAQRGRRRRRQRRLDAPVLAGRVQAGARRRRGRATRAAAGAARDFSNYGWWVDAARARREPAVHLRHEQDQGRPGRDAAAGHRPDDHLRRLGRVGRHVVRAPRSPPACSRARCRATGSRPPRTPRMHLLSTSPPAPQPDFPLAVLVDELERVTRSSSRESRSARRAAARAAARRPARRPSSTKRPSSSACTRQPVLAGALDRHRRRSGREQLALQAALARAGRDDLELDPQVRRLEAQLPRARRRRARAVPASSSGVGAVAHQLGELGVDRAPGEGGAGGLVQQRRHRVDVREERAQLGFGVLCRSFGVPPVGGGDAFTLGQPAQALQAPLRGSDRCCRSACPARPRPPRSSAADPRPGSAAGSGSARRARRRPATARGRAPPPATRRPAARPSRRSGSSSVGTCRAEWRSVRRHSRRAVVASQAPTRSGSCRRPRCSTRRSQVVCTTSEASAVESRCDRATDQTSPL